MITEESSWGLKQNKSYPKLNKNIEADVVIVGAGLAGIFNAYVLSKSGIKVVVLEKNEDILQSATMQTTAFITKVIDTSFQELIRLYGIHKAKLVWESGQDAINFIAQIVKHESIDCEFKFASIHTYAQNEKELDELKTEHSSVRQAGFESEFSKDGKRLNFKNSGFLANHGQAMFHPLKFGQALAKLAESAGARIYTDSEVLAIEGRTVKTKTGQVDAEDVIIATYQPLINEGTRFKKGMYVSYVFELQVAKGHIPEGMYIDMNNPYHYFRIDSFGDFDRMIIGGEDHRKDIRINPDKNFSALEKYIKILLGRNKYKITRKWDGQILESTDGLPFMGRIKPHTFVITAFSGNGMTYAALSAMIVRDLIRKQKNVYIHLYDPKRTQSLKQLVSKGIGYIEEFFGGAFKNYFLPGDN